MRRSGVGVALSPLVQGTMAVSRLTLLEVGLAAVFAFEKFQHHVRCRLAARPMGAKDYVSRESVVVRWDWFWYNSLCAG